MAIHLAESSPTEIETVLANVPNHLNAAPPGSLMRAMSEVTDQVSVTQPHRVFVATLEDILSGRLLAGAREATTRYFLVHADNEPFAAAEVSGAQFIHLNEGPFVEGTARAMVAAEQLDATNERDYELRLLRIPAVYVTAVWLASPSDDILIPADPAPEPLIAGQAYNEVAFTGALKPFAAMRSNIADNMA
jgi:hypothetical protein